MDIRYAFASASQLVRNFESEGVLGHLFQQSQHDAVAFTDWKKLFLRFFERLENSDIDVLTFLRAYGSMRYIYDKFSKTEAPVLSSEDAATLMGVLSQVQEFHNRLFPLASLHPSASPKAPVLVITFPLVANGSNLNEFLDETQWFLRVLNRAYQEISTSASPSPIINRVDNVDVSISIDVTWEFMLVTLIFGGYITRLVTNLRRKTTAFNSLREMGVPEEKIAALEADVDVNSTADFETALHDIGEIIGAGKEGEPSAALRAYFLRMREAKEKNYRIGYNLPRTDGETFSKRLLERPIEGQVKSLLQSQRAAEIAAEASSPALMAPPREISS